MKLFKSVQGILDSVKVKTGKEALLVPVQGMATMAEVKIARKHNDAHRIFYNSDSPDEVNHLIGCKCLQIIRTFEVPGENRLMGVSYQDNYNNARMQIEAEANVKPELREVLNNNELVSSWVLGLINQLISQPADLVVEKMLYETCPDLRELQKNVLEKQFVDYTMTLNPQVRDLSPSVVFDASAIMNYVYLRILDDEIGTDFTARTEHVYKKKRAEALYEFTKANTGGTVEQDRLIIDHWAEKLKIRTWYEWADFEDVPKDY
ncbi:MAG: hypothetical protein JXR86_14600 [Spirochaetales bacterium]|nr:hypothetical protein [Spirochaetales bacterium]